MTTQKPPNREMTADGESQKRYSQAETKQRELLEDRKFTT